jgi:polysaccharide biosynthesis transport protein
MLGDAHGAERGDASGVDRGAAAAGAGGLFGNAADRSAFDIAEYWRLAIKYRLLILGTLLAASVIGVAATLLMTPIYTASATLQIDREAARVLNVDEVQPRESMVQGEEFFPTQYAL